jgi:hypothetical protein
MTKHHESILRGLEEALAFAKGERNVSLRVHRLLIRDGKVVSKWTTTGSDETSPTQTRDGKLS